MQHMDGEIAADRYINGETELDILSKAMIFAAHTHKSLGPGNCFVPSVLHSAETALIASGMTGDMDVVIAALLHDVIDEGKAEAADIKMEFGVRVLKYVEFKKFQERKGHLIDYLFSKASAEERIIILSDALSTMRFLNRELVKPGTISWEKYGGQEKEVQEWYYKGLRDALGRMQDTDAWKEFKLLINLVFDDHASVEAAGQTVIEQKSERGLAGFVLRLVGKIKDGCAGQTKQQIAEVSIDPKRQELARKQE
jgi:hypothetical protein